MLQLESDNHFSAKEFHGNFWNSCVRNIHTTFKSHWQITEDGGYDIFFVADEYHEYCAVQNKSMKKMTPDNYRTQEVKCIFWWPFGPSVAPLMHKR